MKERKVMPTDRSSLAPDIYTSAISTLRSITRSWITKIRFWYFTDIDALGHRAIGSMDPSRVPNALVGHHWTFFFITIATAMTLPYAGQVISNNLALTPTGSAYFRCGKLVQKYGKFYPQSILKPIDVTFLLLSLFLSTITAAIRQTYIWKTRSLELDHAKLIRRYKGFERRFNIWPLPVCTGRFISLLT
uniref:Uncharacterized protein n=1 Tax=Spongospora subterranea TaxID=70186 RepID=A0A0H5QL34_9EUKA|eukprot:CRZ02830.1 hypothetical protein [Spongospora subterranea]